VYEQGFGLLYLFMGSGGVFSGLDGFCGFDCFCFDFVWVFIVYSICGYDFNGYYDV